MSEDIVQFPNKNQSYYRHGLRSLQAGDYPTGIELLEKSLAIEFELGAFVEAIQAAIAHNDSKKIKYLWQKYFKDHREIGQLELLALLYVESIDFIYPSHERLIELINFRETLLDKQYNFDLIDFKIKQYQNVEMLKLKLRDIQKKQKVNDFVQDLLQLKQFDIFKKMKELYLIESELTEPIFEAILKSTQFLHFIKSDILHHYIYQNIKKDVKMMWFNELRDINTAKLEEYYHNELYRTMTTMVTDYCEKENPQLEIYLREQLTFQALVFYPFLGELSLTAQQWFDYLMESIVREEGIVSEMDETTKKLLKEADKEINQLVLKH